MALGTVNDATARASFRTMRPLRLLAILACAAVCASCGEETLPPAHLGPPESWIPLAEGRRWTHEAREGTEKTTIACRSFGGDVRDLADRANVRFQFVYGVPEGYDHDVTKSIFALPPDGPRLFYLDAMLWSLGFDPALPLLPPEPRVGDSWEWSGSLDLDRDPAPARARLEVEARETVRVPAGSFDALRVRLDAGSGRVVTCWYARDVGLVRCDVARANAAEPERSLVLVSWEAPR